MISPGARWSLPRGNTLVPSRWQATLSSAARRRLHLLSSAAMPARSTMDMAWRAEEVDRAAVSKDARRCAGWDGADRSIRGRWRAAN